MVIRRKGDYALENGAVVNDPKVIAFICDMKMDMNRYRDRIATLENERNYYYDKCMSEDSLKKQAREKK